MNKLLVTGADGSVDIYQQIDFDFAQFLLSKRLEAS